MDNIDNLDKDISDILKKNEPVKKRNINLLKKDEMVLGLMTRKKVMHDIMSSIKAIQKNKEEELYHLEERDETEKRIKSFAKSFYKKYSLVEIEEKLKQDKELILEIICSDIANMPSYTPCEDCTYCHKDINGDKLDLADLGKYYCSLHKNWGIEAAATDSQRVKDCLTENWEDFYQKSPEDIELLKKYVKNIVKNR